MKETITTAEKLEIHYPLREYQIEWIEKIYRAWDRGQRKVLAQLPTAASDIAIKLYPRKSHFNPQ